MRLTIHRGTHTIGGSCVELGPGNSRIVIDLGMPLMHPDGTEFNFKRYEKLTGQELLNAGILPPVEGLYEWQTPSVDGLLISHAHQDHYGFLNHVHPEIPIFMGEGTKRLIEITTLFTPSKTHLKKPVIFSWPGKFTVGDFKIVPHLVDHSSFGAFAFEIEAGGKRLFYSGDFREHGYLGKTLEIIEDRCAPGVDGLLMEGTMFGREAEPVQTEQNLADEAKIICRECPKAVLVYQSGQNVSRAVSFYKAALHSGREFVLDFYTAHVLTELGKCTGGKNLPYPGNLRGIKVWYPSRLRKNMADQGRWDIINQYNSKTPFFMSRKDMTGHLDKIMLYVRPHMESDLKRIPDIGGSVLLYSLWKGYRENETSGKFLEAIRSLGIKEHYVHTSGHAPIPALQHLVDIVQPKRLIPIHTQYPKDFKQFGVPVEEIEDGVAIEL